MSLYSKRVIKLRSNALGKNTHILTHFNVMRDQSDVTQFDIFNLNLCSFWLSSIR